MATTEIPFINILSHWARSQPYDHVERMTQHYPIEVRGAVRKCDMLAHAFENRDPRVALLLLKHCNIQEGELPRNAKEALLSKASESTRNAVISYFRCSHADTDSQVPCSAQPSDDSKQKPSQQVVLVDFVAAEPRWSSLVSVFDSTDDALNSPLSLMEGVRLDTMENFCSYAGVSLKYLRSAERLWHRVLWRDSRLCVADSLTHHEVVILLEKYPEHVKRRNLVVELCYE